MKQPLTLIAAAAFTVLLIGCSNSRKTASEAGQVTLVTLDPGHFHAALVQKNKIDGVASNVYVYAPEGAELNAHLELIRQFNTRKENPTAWNEVVYTGSDFAEKIFAEKKGNVVVLAGNNQLKTKYIDRSVDSGLHVLADKPMAITMADFNMLVKSFGKSRENKVLLYDIMTERSEITNILQRELARDTALFGELQNGSAENPAVVFENVHYFFKQVSGKDLVRPAWFFDAAQQGEAIADVGTHVVDLVQWECFPDQAIDYKKDVEIISAKLWPTILSREQFSSVTGRDSFPSFLLKDVKNNQLNTHANGEINYTIRNKHIRVTTRWDYKAEEGGDTHYALLKGTKARLEIRQGKKENYKPTLYIYPEENINENDFITSMKTSIDRLFVNYPGVNVERDGKGYMMIIPDKYKVGHEAHFSEVMERFLDYLRNQNMPSWEVPCMITKYYITTRAVELASGK